MKKTAKPAVLALLFCSLLLGSWSCPLSDDDGEEKQLRERLEQSRARTKEAREQARREQGRRRAAEGDFTVAAAVSISCVVALLLVMGLLVRERRRRKILARLLQFLRRKNNEKNLRR